MSKRSKILLFAYSICVLIWSGIAFVGLSTLNDHDDVTFASSAEH
ncbi:hypothetical protein Rleg_5969 (plasmid) [Rhizobium leguminosarum bv. trifolii WSM1325]|uniref:Uncharacterized protein n=1 Tax=Rhizobium leguminosarum bv. trifolii (strain WSM1325) TaxID=395491 RepID=C6B8J8_RHILS|nr:hypothetical protein Rleg_5969 [Rhizobium leguminosarum bv. trifolii WSM1325]